MEKPPLLPSAKSLPGFRCFAVMILFLLPLKFSSMAVTTTADMHAGAISLNPLHMLLFCLPDWPASGPYMPVFLLPVLAGLLLLWALAIFPLPAWGRHWWLPGVWILLLVGFLPGLLNTTEWNVTEELAIHFLGAACLALATFLWVSWDKHARTWIIVAIVLASLLLCCYGWEQHFGGLARMEQQAKASGQAIPDQIMRRLAQRRAYGTFGYPNVYAGFLLLTGPLCCWALWRFGSFFEPRRWSQLFLLGLALTLWLGALWFSESRAAILALAAGLGLGILLEPRLARWRWWLLAGGLAGAALLIVMVSLTGGRNILGSLYSRLEYWQAGFTMFCQHPLAGVGWGEYFPWHQLLKPENAEMARTPHCFVMKFASQAGIVGLLASLVLLALPFRMALGHFGTGPQATAKEDRKAVAGRWLVVAVTTGTGAFLIHSLADVNFWICACVSVAAVMPMLLVEANAVAAAAPIPARLSKGGMAAAGIAAVAVVSLAPGYLKLLKLETLAPDEKLTPAGNLQIRQLAVEAVAKAFPNYMEPWQDLSRDYIYHGMVDPATEAIDKAVARTPHRVYVLADAVETHLIRIAGGREPATITLGLIKQARPWIGQDRPLQSRFDTAETVAIALQKGDVATARQCLGEAEARELKAGGQTYTALRWHLAWSVLPPPSAVKTVPETIPAGPAAGPR